MPKYIKVIFAEPPSKLVESFSAVSPLKRDGNMVSRRCKQSPLYRKLDCPKQAEAKPARCETVSPFREILKLVTLYFKHNDNI